MIKGATLFSMVCGSLSIWLFSGVLINFISQTKLNNLKKGEFRSWLNQLINNNLGMHIAHLGVAVFLAGITGEQFFKTEINGRKNIGDIIKIGDRFRKFDDIKFESGPNYKSEMAIFTLSKNNNLIDTLKPEKRFYPVQQTQTTEAAILSEFFGDTYLVLGDGNKEIGWSVRLYYNPLVSWIWGGACLMALGGIISIFRNRKTKPNIIIRNTI